jgi:hypothetical protein
MEDLPKHNNLLIRNGTYYFRVRVPQDLLASIGKKEIKVSLKTKDPREIKSKLALESLKAEDLFESARRALTPPPEALNPTRILAAVAKHQIITTTEVDRIVLLCASEMSALQQVAINRISIERWTLCHQCIESHAI